MELLLLLSAFLSALTGAISGVRAPEVPLEQTVARVTVAAEHIVAPRQAIGTLISQPLPSLIAVADAPIEHAAWSVSAAVPLYADRLRE